MNHDAGGRETKTRVANKEAGERIEASGRGALATEVSRNFILKEEPFGVVGVHAKDL